jgi:type III pantothenate kinase
MSQHEAPILIAVDIGNGAAKLGAFENWRAGDLGEPAWTLRVETSALGAEDWTPDVPAKSCAWSVVSVHRDGQQRLAKWVARRRSQDTYRLLARGDLPLVVRVDHPDRVGVDRLAAAVGANALRSPGRPAVVVDSGTAITVDLVSSAGEFLGGAILPGVGMSARALAQETDALPLVDPAWRIDPPEALGRSTIAAIRSGLFWGALGAIRELATQMARGLPPSEPPPQVFLTGGDAPLLAPWLGAEAIAAPHLVLWGIVLAARGLKP